ncbi:hypothetical protein DFQ27_007019 [Actinomortierella ambigua]|uniref:Uncharacterized protein n=1 Tax=Actinomortierella ambigua TaxID=1343610 RepID=A0A9P6U093_9FUNG|nr:hypothetical protein DFQ27_007019 [Actinomortierella ambigua]
MATPVDLYTLAISGLRVALVPLASMVLAQGSHNNFYTYGGTTTLCQDISGDLGQFFALDPPKWIKLPEGL